MAQTLADDTLATPPRTSTNVLSRLSVMMFLQYFVQGAYLPVVSVYVKDALGFTPWEVGAFAAALAVGPILAPLVLGQLVDRHFATERVLACCHLLAGAIMLTLYVQTNFWPVMILGTIYSLLYVPSMMLTNSLAFYHLRRRDREFPLVRVFGTIGFVVPAWFIEFYWLRGLTGETLNHARGIVFLLGGLAGVVMGLYALTLPHTPPNPRADRPNAPGAVLALLLRYDLLVLVLASFVIAMAHKFFFVWNSPYLTSILRSGNVQGAYEQSISSIGQISEVLVMVTLGMVLAKIGFKRTLVIGASAYVARCLLFAVAIQLEGSYELRLGLAIFGQVMHGLCFAMFLATAFMYVDRVSPADLRGSMQNIYGTSVLGIGFLVGAFAAGGIGHRFTTGEGPAAVQNWPGIWLSCAALAAVGTVGLAIFFPRDAGKAASS